MGGGPAGLTAGLYLSRAKRRTLLLEKENFGGTIINIERIENYPGFANGVAGALLASQMVSQATSYGLKLAQAEVVAIKLFSSCRLVRCADGTSYTTSVVIVAGGARHKPLNVPGEERLRGKGLISCAVCEGGQLTQKVVAVCGGGDSGITEALYLTKLASKVIVIEAMPALGASAILRNRMSANPTVEVRTGTKVGAILGDGKVEGIELIDTVGQKTTLPVDGVLVHIGLIPNTDYLKNLPILEDEGRIGVNDRMETRVPFILAAGDIRSRSPNQISTAVGDGATAALAAERLLQQMI